jgi:hypothetical protein
MSQSTPVEPPGEDSAPVTTLRGARVEVDGRRVGRAFIVLCLLTLLVLAAVFFAVGANKNAQINALRNHGVPVTITATSCNGLIGGSGSNLAGYACSGTYTFGGKRYARAIPGDVLPSPGSRIEGVVAPSDPGLVSTASIIAQEHASARVFILPAILLAVVLALVGVIVQKRRSAHSR